MLSVPQRVSLVAQAEQVLAAEIAASRWRGRLPAERQLSKELQISRGTLRSALAALAARKLIRIRPGELCEIVAARARRKRGSHSWRIACLAPEPLSQMAPFVVIWIDDLRSRLQRIGAQLDVYDQPLCFRTKGPGRLAKFVRQNPHDCWLLLLSTETVQQWFRDQGLPAIVAGSLYPGIELPSIDINFRAIGRHAAGMIFARGHRKLAFLASRRGKGGVAPGELEIECGLREALAVTPHPNRELVSVCHNDGTADVCAALDRLLRLPQRPTVLLIASSATFLSALTHLAQRRVAIPGDLSIVVSHDESYFRYIVPELTHYKWNPENVALQMSRLIRHTLSHAPLAKSCVRLMPNFVTGRTLIPLGSTS